MHERTRSNSNKEKGQKGSYIELTGKSSLQGEEEKGIDDYTGTYTADYANFSGTEYLFGGTSIKRESGKELSIDCTLEITEGTAKVFWISGSDEAVTFSRAYETAVLIFRAAVSLRLQNLPHLPTSVDFHQDITLYIQEGHQWRVRLMHSLIQV